MTDTSPLFDRHHEGLTDKLRFILMRDTRNHQWVSEAWLRVDDGLRHQVMRWHKRPRLTEILAECKGTGFFSKRPYTLAQACDGSISAPVMALYADFCHARGLDPVTLLRRAYDDEDDCSPESLQRLRTIAERERTAFPATWHTQAVDGLLVSLHEINYHQLAALVEDCARHAAVREPERTAA